MFITIPLFSLNVYIISLREMQESFTIHLQTMFHNSPKSHNNLMELKNGILHLTPVKHGLSYCAFEEVRNGIIPLQDSKEDSTLYVLHVCSPVLLSNSSAFLLPQKVLVLYSYNFSSRQTRGQSMLLLCTPVLLWNTSATLLPDRQYLIFNAMPSICTQYHVSCFYYGYSQPDGYMNLIVISQVSHFC